MTALLYHRSLRAAYRIRTSPQAIAQAMAPCGDVSPNNSFHWPKVQPLKVMFDSALQRHSTQNLKQIFPEKELRGLSPNSNSYIHVSVSEVYIPTISVPILQQKNK
jgi:hypothetical protein